MIENNINYKLYPILYIDDEKGNLIAFETSFSDDYTIFAALSAEEGLEIIKNNPSVAVVVTDQKLGKGKMEGTVLSALLKRDYPDIVRIILTAYKEFDIAFESINRGHIYKYICKPWDHAQIDMDLKRSIQLYISNKERKQTTLTIVDSMVKTFEAKNYYTSGHSEKVTKYAILTLEKIKEKGLKKDIPPQLFTLIQGAGRLHDLGKIALPDEIINKPGDLTKEEYDEVKKHPVIGANMLQLVDDLSQYAPLVRHHHERWNGTGYPDGLKGENIPLGARILAVADTYSAITSDRPYRLAGSPDDAAIEILRCKNTQFDPDVVDAFIEVLMFNKLILQRIN
ncbi:MAG: HD-GYP domain-containing protein [bacterium]